MYSSMKMATASVLRVVSWISKPAQRQKLAYGFSSVCQKVNLAGSSKYNWRVPGLQLLNQHSSNHFHSSVTQYKGENLPKSTVVHVVHGEDEDLGEMTYGELERLAKRAKKNFSAAPADADKDPSHPPVYRLHSEISHNKVESHITHHGQVKTIIIKTKINDHDLSIKKDKVMKWIEKGYSVEVEIITVQKSDPHARTNVLQMFKEELKDRAFITEATKTAEKLILRISSSHADTDEKKRPKMKVLKHEELKKKK